MKRFFRPSRDIAHTDVLPLSTDSPESVANDSLKEETLAAHRGAFSDARFWRKLADFGSRAGHEVVRKALQLYFVLKRPDVPFWAKSTIIGALGYFISPLDAIPDVIFGAGYVDDASVLAAALVAVSIYIDDEIKQQADAVLTRWWPDGE
ncbi:YkvA family protein [Salinicola aestuarinus]|uniref:YkvA family protein n=1 Tax=Salinicola aestuarinus TaxID=1949082 RepID=UPI000DA2147C|nr:DUF1232 domain-containing protein [Salinicola aestuarinus]